LKSLDKDYSDKRALEILWHIGKSSAFPLRVKTFEYLLNTTGEFSTSQIARELQIGKSTATRELQTMWNIGLVKRRDVETNYPGQFYYYWRINQNHNFVKELLLIPSENI